MKSICIVIILLFSTFIQTFSQDWVPEFFNGRWDQLDSVVAELGNEMKKEIGNNAPELVFHDIENDSTKMLSDYRGKIVIVNLWSTNCSGSRMQIPELSKLQKEYYDEGLRVLYIAGSNKDSLHKYYSNCPTEGIKTLMEANDIKKLKRPYQYFAKPSAFIVDKNGIVRDAWIGPEKYEALEKRILPFVQK